MFYTTTYDSELVGAITIASDGSSIVGLWLVGQKYYGGTVGEEMAENDALPVLGQAKKWLDRYFAGEKPAIAELPLAPRGSAFRQRVWNLLIEIPYGQTRTYGDLAQQISCETGKRMANQAVGGAVGHNPISIIVPCHRVVGTNGSLTGYAGGLKYKQLLLAHEGVDMSGFFVPTKGTAL